MFLVFTLLLLVVAVGILASVYSVFFPFMQNIGTVNNYYTAYYGAVSAVERAQLGLRYRQPGFVGSGGFFGTTGYGPISDYTPEILSGAQQGFGWMINSRTNSISFSGMGNTDFMLSDSTSKNYNQIGYTHLESFFLSYDDTSDLDFYSTGVSPLVFFSGDSITGIFRLPSKLFSEFGGGINPGSCLNQNDGYLDNCTVDANSDGLYDDEVLSWTLSGNYKGNSFTISPTISGFVYSGGKEVDSPHDNVIRESIINATGIITFDASSSHGFSPITNGAGIVKHTVVVDTTSEIQDKKFSEIFSSSDFTGLRLSFGAANLFRTRSGFIYPYLEYQFIFSQPIADRFYTIQGHGRVGDYDVQIIIKKPTIEGTIGGNFTVVF